MIRTAVEKFQDLRGAIQTRCLKCSRFPARSSCSKTSVVRFKPVFNDAITTTTEFQYLRGPIQTVDCPPFLGNLMEF